MSYPAPDPYLYELVYRYWTDQSWREPLSAAVAAFLKSRPGEVFSATSLTRNLGFSGDSGDPACNALTKKLHILRGPGGLLDGYWQESKRTVQWKDANGNRRHAIEWRYDPNQPPRPVQPFQMARAVPGAARPSNALEPFPEPEKLRPIAEALRLVKAKLTYRSTLSAEAKEDGVYFVVLFDREGFGPEDACEVDFVLRPGGALQEGVAPFPSNVRQAVQDNLSRMMADGEVRQTVTPTLDDLS